jgi:hypothetical protein
MAAAYLALYHEVRGLLKTPLALTRPFQGYMDPHAYPNFDAMIKK